MEIILRPAHDRPPDPRPWSKIEAAYVVIYFGIVDAALIGMRLGRPTRDVYAMGYFAMKRGLIPRDRDPARFDSHYDGRTIAGRIRETVFSRP